MRERFMPKAANKASSFIQLVRFVGRSGGLVRTLGGFKKGHHTVPDAVNNATSAFLSKLCDAELKTEAEQFFQQARAAFGYKRKELSLEIATPVATLTAKDFSFEINYALDGEDAASYVVTRTLSGLRSGDFAATQECGEVFAGQFGELSFVLTKGAPVETVIDAVEGLDGEGGLTVDYPSDCHHCILAVPNVSATVRFEGGELSMVFPRNGSPGELLESFFAVREAFCLTKQPVLAGLIG